ncbi:MAG: hypothetical protein QF893_21695, partial [Alphaproteobacteria bacterium]|nr:hypothetical protein [Alphaproteobacteria bacterium]
MEWHRHHHPAVAGTALPRRHGGARGGGLRRRESTALSVLQGAQDGQAALAPVTASNACVKPARSEPAKATRHKKVGCPRGSFFDPRKGGECWSCPSGYKRSLAPVTAKNACAKSVFGKTARAKYRGKHGCGRGQFFDPRKGGECWSCPSGYKRSLAPVTATNACVRPGKKQLAKAQYHKKLGCARGAFLDIGRGECWSCPSGYGRSLHPVTDRRACVARQAACGSGLINVGGTCRRKGQCGGNGARPCLVIERIPSCNKGLKEDFGKNRCVPLRPGETPFTAGLASLTGEIAKGTDICQDVLTALPQLKSGIRPLDLAAGCSNYMNIGFVCAVPSSVNKIKESAELLHRFNKEYNRSPCKDTLKWYHASATRHGKSKGLSCPRGQFFDLIQGGTCWSCPRKHVRSLEPVTSRAACARAGGTPPMFRSLCAGVMAMTRDADKAVQCLAAMIRTGTLAQAFRGREKDLCLIAGEETYFTVLDYLTAT